MICLMVVFASMFKMGYGINGLMAGKGLPGVVIRVGISIVGVPYFKRSMRVKG